MDEISENAVFEIEIDIVPSACVYKTNISFIDMSTSLKCSEMVIFKCLDFIIIIDDNSRFTHLKHTKLKIPNIFCLIPRKWKLRKQKRENSTKIFVSCTRKSPFFLFHHKSHVTDASHGKISVFRYQTLTCRLSLKYFQRIFGIFCRFYASDNSGN